MRNKILKEFKVLLVEDEEKLATLLKGAIGDSFYSFSVARDGREGLEKFLQINPDIIITDIMMPHMTGLEMSKEIKKIDADIPIIILSAYRESDKFIDAIDIGVVKYFIKPFDPDELLEYIESLSKKLESKIISFIDGFSFNFTTNSLYKDFRFIYLSKNEIKFIRILLKNHNGNDIVDDETIKRALWIEEVSDERLRTFIKRFRSKTSKKLVQNVKGYGYKLNLITNN